MIDVADVFKVFTDVLPSTFVVVPPHVPVLVHATEQPEIVICKPAVELSTRVLVSEVTNWSVGVIPSNVPALVRSM